MHTRQAASPKKAPPVLRPRFIAAQLILLLSVASIVSAGQAEGQDSEVALVQPGVSQQCSLQDEGVEYELTMDAADSRIHYPYNSAIENGRGYPGLEQGVGRIFQDGAFVERPIIRSEDVVRYGDASLHYSLPARQPGVDYGADITKDRLETRLIDRADFSAFLGVTYYTGFSVYIPSTVEPVGQSYPGFSHWNLISQVHQSSPESPPIGLNIENDSRSRLEISILRGEDKSRVWQTILDPLDRQDTAVEIPLGTWIDLTYAWRIDPFTDGGRFTLYYFDPSKPESPPYMMFDYEGPLGYTKSVDRSAVTQGIGIYRSASPDNGWEIYFDQARVGTDWNSVLPWKETTCWRIDESSGSAGNDAVYWAGVELEAEAATLTGGFEVVDDGLASAGQFIRVPEGADPALGGSAVFSFDVDDPGFYVLQGDVRARDGSSDSFFVQINDGPSDPFFWSTARTEGSSFVRDEVTDYPSRSAVVAFFAEGTHTVTVSMREAGTELDTLRLIPAENARDSVALGDVNCDLDVDNIDAMQIVQYLTLSRTAIESCQASSAQPSIHHPSADVTLNSEISVLDALMIAQCSQGIPHQFCR